MKVYVGIPEPKNTTILVVTGILGGGNGPQVKTPISPVVLFHPSETPIDFRPLIYRAFRPMSPPLTTVLNSGISEKFTPKLQGTAGCRDSSAATVDVLSPTFPSQIVPPWGEKRKAGGELLELQGGAGGE